MEKQLFEYEDWDVVDTMLFSFYNVILVQQIGDFPIGSKFESACINYETGELTLYEKEIEHKFTLSLVVNQE